MKVDIAEIIGRLKNVAEEKGRETNDKFVQTYGRMLKGYLALLEKSGEIISRIPHDDSSLHEAFTNTLDCLETSRKWLQSVSGILDHLIDDSMRESFRDSLLELTGDIPEKITIPVPDGFWAPSPGDHLTTRIGKSLRFTAIRLRRTAVSVISSVMKLFGKPARKAPKITRSFSLHNFLYRFTADRLLESYDKYEQSLIKTVSDTVHVIHDSADQLYRGVLTNNDESEPEKTFTGESVNNIAALLDEQKSVVRQAILSIPSAPSEAFDRFIESMEVIKEVSKIKYATAGSFILPEKEFGEENIRAYEQRLDSHRARNRQLWDKHIRGEEEDWHKDIEIAVLRLHIEKNRFETSEYITDTINTSILTALEDANFMIAETLDVLNESDLSDEKRFMDNVQSESAVLQKNLRETAIPRIMDAVLKGNIEQRYRSFFDTIQSSLDIIGEEHIIFELRDESNVPPQSKTSRVALKELISNETVSPLAEKHASTMTDIHDRIERTFRAITEIDRIVEYNVNAALELIKSADDEATADYPKACSIVIEGLERTNTQINELKGDYEKIRDLSGEYLHEMTVTFISGLLELGNNEMVLELKLRLARAKTRENIRRFIAISVKRTLAAVRSIIPVIISAMKAVRAWYRRFRKIAGLEVPAIGIDLKVAEYLIESRQRLERLPYVYQLLFNLKPLTDRRFFSARTNEIDRLKEVYRNWQTGKPMSVSVIGERGSGKTTLVHFIETDILSTARIIRIDLLKTVYRESELLDYLRNAFGEEEAESLDDLETRILEQEERFVCIFENLHNMYLRTVDGFEALERFMLFIQRTESKILWIVSCALYGWRYLDQVVRVSKYFGTVVELSYKNREEIEDTILKRHRVSGYLLEFDVTPAIVKLRAYRKLQSDEDRKAFLRRRFFDQLAGLAAGNIRVVILFWLTAIREVTKEKMVLSPDIEFDHSFVYQLPPDELFTLAALIQHEMLNAERHARIFRQDIRDSLLILNRMERIGYLLKSEETYSIHPFMYRPVVKALQSKNILQ